MGISKEKKGEISVLVIYHDLMNAIFGMWIILAFVKSKASIWDY